MLYILIILLLIVCVILSCLLTKNSKKDKQLIFAEKDKHHAVDETIGALKKLLNAHKNNNIDEKHWRQNVCRLFQENYRSDGCCLIRAVADHKNNREYEMLAGSGCCENWHEPKSDDNFIFDSRIKKHFYWSADAHLLTDNIGECLPDDQGGKYSSLIAGAFKIHKHDAFLLLVRKLDQKLFSMDDVKEFEPSFHIARAGMEIVNYVNENKHLSESIDKAHEEGMLQISSGIIHNIGNGMAVIKMTLEHLEEFKSIIQLSQFLKDEVLPGVEKDVKSLEGGSQLEEYLVVIKEIMDKINITAQGHNEELQKLHDKFQDVIEIISLQQQFIGELGTENVVSIKTILNEVVKMIQQPLEQGKIELKQDIKTMSEVLLDPALFRQVLLVICKYSINSINTSRHAKSYLEIAASNTAETETNENDEKITTKVISIEINNNGYGIEFDSNAEISGQSKDAQRHRELLFCKNKIEKYGGSFVIESSEGLGANVLISIPVYEK